MIKEHAAYRNPGVEGHVRNRFDAAIISSAANSLIAAFDPSAGACYRCAFFLRLFLKEHFGIEGEAVVGFINDGQDDVYSSHAWFEYNGKKTDVAISRPLMPFVLPGPLTIHGVDISPGHAWTYYSLRTNEGELLAKTLLNSDHPFAPFLRAHEVEHATMLAISDNDDLIRLFLDQAPDGIAYRHIASAVKGEMIR